MSVSSQRLKGKRGAVPGAEALIGLSRAEFLVEIELNRAQFGSVSDTKGPNARHLTY